MNSNITMFLARAIVLIIAIPVHESAHALVSYWLGDPTAKQAGRITMNPFKHFDLMGSLCLLFAGIGWAKPVPIDPRYYRNPKRDMALSALAGPVSNILMASVAIIILKLFVFVFQVEGAVWIFVAEVLYYMVIVNITLGIFNLLPVPPFDGSRIFLTFLPAKAYFGVMKYERYIMIAVFAAVFFGLLDVPLQFLYTVVFNFLDRATFFLGMLRF